MEEEIPSQAYLVRYFMVIVVVASEFETSCFNSLQWDLSCINFLTCIDNLTEVYFLKKNI